MKTVFHKFPPQCHMAQTDHDTLISLSHFLLGSPPSPLSKLHCLGMIEGDACPHWAGEWVPSQKLLSVNPVT